jgi:hypothetical protein
VMCHGFGIAHAGLSVITNKGTTLEDPVGSIFTEQPVKVATDPVTKTEVPCPPSEP